MSIDERIAQLTASQEKTDTMMAKNQVMLADILDGIMRLERIALSHEVRLQDVEATLTTLEGKTKRPQ
jgi:DNA-binding TFAR19-related protein (PDSD5 family)